jgi:hypothetical protein
MSGVTAALPPHGTPERWQADCDCFECQEAMRQKVGQSVLPRNSGWLLERMLEYRVQGCELYVVPAMIANYSPSTVRRHIDILVSDGVLSKVDLIPGQAGRSGIYLLHTEKLIPRPELKLYKEFRRLNESEGMSQAMAWRLMMLKEHETCEGDLCTRCGHFATEYGERCVHCHVIRNDVRVRCPVCQDGSLPKTFLDPKMQGELERVEKARTAFFQPRRLVLVKS